MHAAIVARLIHQAESFAEASQQRRQNQSYRRGNQKQCEICFQFLTPVNKFLSDRGVAQKIGSAESAFRGRLKIAQRFIAGFGRNRDEVRAADG